MKLAVALLLAASGVAQADAPPIPGVEVDREDAPAGRAEFGFDGGAPLDGWGISLGVGVLEKPLTIDPLGPPGPIPVRKRETVVLGGAIALGRSVVLDLRLPLSRQVGDNTYGGGDAYVTDQYATTYALGDLRVAARIRIAGDADRAAFLRGALTFPTGDSAAFAGDGHWSVAWNLIGRATLPAGIIIAGSAGIHIRGAEVTVGDRLVGDEITGAAGVIVPIPPIAGLWCHRDQVKLTAELDGALGDYVDAMHGPSPLEARGGIVIQALPELAIGLRGGRGLDDQLGAPAWRAMLEVAWRGDWQLFPAQPAGPPSDETLDD